VREPRAGVLGTGLIGASIGLGLAGRGWQVIGWDPDEAALATAAERGAVTSRADSMESLASSDLDLLVVATPPKATPRVLEGLTTGALVTDVTGVKHAVIDAGSHLRRFVSSHPMAGREVSGPRAGDASLFNGAAWIVITDGASEGDMTELERVARLLGAHPERLDAATHDRVVTAVSHLPQLLASALITEATTAVPDLSLVGGSFRDLTRVAASDPTMWTELLDANRALVGEMLGRFGERLSQMARIVSERRTDDMTATLEHGARLYGDLHAPVGLVEVALPDRPGELAAVGRALDHARVDVRDLQLRHAPYGGGGLLRVFVNNDDLAILSGKLRAEGLTVTREEKR
jgi:prephenate dehydrogenase